MNVQMAVVALAKIDASDFVYIARPENFADGFGEFHQMLHTFETRTSRRCTNTDPNKVVE